MGRLSSPTGYGENGFLDLGQGEVSDHIQLEMRQVRQFVWNDCGVNDRRPAQQKAMPVIGFLGSLGPGPSAPLVAAFREGLSEIGFEDGQSVAIEYRWAEGRFDQLPKSSLSSLG
jgi:hypothetical protein